MRRLVQVVEANEGKAAERHVWTMAALDRVDERLAAEGRRRSRMWRETLALAGKSGGASVDLMKFTLPLVLRPWVWIPGVLALIALVAGAQGVVAAGDILLRYAGDTAETAAPDPELGPALEP
jgi:hypothetical protein